ncbi:MAG: ClC family H(+)/Cl(-) exchange transporter, partial [Dermatophilaceae bacterium]
MVLSAAATVLGAGTGFVATTFRLVLERAAELRLTLSGWGHDNNPVLGFALVVGGCATATAAAAWLVHRVEPHAEGSGIPRIEGVVAGRIEPARYRLLPVKYVGGVLAIGSGLSLGREGPSVQMGGMIAHIVSSVTRRNSEDSRALIAAGAGAGLATAFIAPLAGGVFVLEEIAKRFDPRITLATVFASASGFAVAHLMLGDELVLQIGSLPPPSLRDGPSVLVVGVLAGLLGVLYNRAIMLGLRLADTSTWPVTLRAALIGALIGAIGWYAPHVVGSGDELTRQFLQGQGTVLGLCVLFVARFLLGVISYAAGTPGGLFAPLLVLGTDIGLLIGLLGDSVPWHASNPTGLAIVGMAAFFAATVRAPVTGLILAAEMTGSVEMLPPALGACAVAMLVAYLLKCEPIYDSLTTRSIRHARENIVT